MVKASDCSIEHIAEQTGWSRNSIYSWMKKEEAYKLDIGKIIKLANVTNLNPREFFSNFDEQMGGVAEPQPVYSDPRLKELEALIDLIADGDAPDEQVKHLKAEVLQLLKENSRYRKQLSDTFEKIKEIKRQAL